MALPPVTKVLGAAADAAKQTPVPPVVPAAVPATQSTKGTGKYWFSNPALKDSITKHLSQHDWLKQHGGQELADKIFRNAPDNQNYSASTTSTFAKNAGDEEIRLTTDVIDKYTGLNSLSTTLMFWKRKPALALRRELEDQTYRYLVDSYYRETKGLPVLPHADPRVQDIADTYRKSKFAQNSLKRQADSGMDVQGIQPSDNYVSVRWDNSKIVRFTKNTEEGIADVAKAIGAEVAENLPGILNKLSVEQLGRGFLNRVRAAAQNTSANPFRGVGEAEAEDILRAAGIEDAEVDHVLSMLKPKLQEAGRSKYHKSRMAIDINKVHFDRNGRPFRLGDFMNTDLVHQLEAYNNVMSHRIGMAKVGFPDELSLRTAFNDVARKYEGDAAKYKEVSEMLDTMFDDTMGRPTGAAMAEEMRTLQTIAQSLFLKRSGLFNIVDYNRMNQRFGYAKVMSKFLPAFKGILKSQPMDVGTARKINDVISGRLINEGRMRSVINLTEDNFGGAVSLTHDWVRAAGQTTKFLNMSEWVRRHQINLVTSIQADYLQSIAKFDGVSNLTGEAADAYTYLKTIGFTDNDIVAIQKQIKAHDLFTDDWLDQALADKLGIILSSSVDDFAVQVRRGELPPLLAYSPVGKVLFPFFTFTAATNQKILRQTYNAGGVSALAVMMAHQAPLAMIVASAANVMDGKEWDEDLLKRAVGIAPGIGYGAFAYTAFDRGEVGSTPTVWALPNAVSNIGAGLVDGDVNKVVKNIPMLSASPVVQTLNNALKE